MELPDDIHDVNWYSSTGKPGQGKTIMMAGIIDGTTAKGAFSGLLELKKGSIITIENGDGKEYNYSVTDIAKISRDEAKNTLPDIQIGNKNEEKLVLLSLTKTNAESTAADTIVVVQAKLK
jgi:sortase (surface protein transpeptidase)